MKNSFQHAFVLHSRPYREHSALVDFFTPQGRIRGVLRKARSKVGSIGRPFIPLEICLQGKGELKTVTQIAAIATPYLLQGSSLFSGLYLNELLVRLLPLEDAYPSLFSHYQNTLQALINQQSIEPLLRSFEWCLLTELGYGFSLDICASGEMIKTEALYIFNPEQGLEKIHQLQAGAFYGHDLLAMSEADWTTKTALNAAKRLMRQVLATHLQGKPLVSRELFSPIKL